MSSSSFTVRIDLPGKAGNTVEMPSWLSPEMRRALLARGVRKPWSHQVAAWQSIRDGKHLVLATPTASGKSLSWAVPVLEALRANREQRALLLFPTKALTADQIAGLGPVAKALDVHIALADGEHDIAPLLAGPQHRWPQIIATNPVMLSHHLYSIKPGGDWSEWLSSLRYLVIDELHLVTGVSGVDVAWTVRRALRHVHGTVQAVGASATLTDPAGHLSAVTSVQGDVEVITKSGAPVPTRHIVAIDGGDEACAAVVSRLVRSSRQVIAYVASRPRAEEVASRLVATLGPEAVAVHHAGVSHKERAAIEHGTRNGTIPVVVATTTLVAGVDVPADAVVAFDLPTSQANLQQLAGRAGRRGRDALIVLSRAANAALSEALHDPAILRELFTGPIRVACNPYTSLMREHLLRAAWEKPLSKQELVLQPLPVQVEIQRLLADGVLIDTPEGIVPDKMPTVPEKHRQSSRERKLCTATGVLGCVSTNDAVMRYTPGAVVPWRNGRRLEVLGHVGTTILVRETKKPLAEVVASPRLIPVGDATSVASRRVAAVIGDALMIISATRLRCTDGTHRALPKPYESRQRTRALQLQTHDMVDEGLVHALLIAAEEVGIPSLHVAHRITRRAILLWDRPGGDGSVDLIAGRLDEFIIEAEHKVTRCTCRRNGCLACTLLVSCSRDGSRTLAAESLRLLVSPLHAAATRSSAG